MAKTKSKPTKSRSARKRAEPTAAVADLSVLARYDPTDSANSHPEWIKKDFPGYVEKHATHADETVRAFAHNGHEVRIITTYRVEVDGKPIQAHLSVDENGEVYTHATPFVSYGSAVDLVKAILDAYPDAFKAGGGGQHGHGGGGHGGH